MKKLLIILAFVATATIGYGQYEDILPYIITSNGETIIRVVDPVSGSALMLRSTLLHSINTELLDHMADGTNPHLVTADQVGLGSVENTALSTWVGSTSLEAVGVLTSGTWNAAVIGSAYISPTLTGKSVNGVTLDATEAATTFLNGAGNYTVPPIGSGGAYTFGSGLSEVGGLVDLGGTLTKDMDIFGAYTYDFNVGGLYSPVQTFSVWAESGFVFWEDGSTGLGTGTGSGFQFYSLGPINLNYKDGSKGINITSEYISLYDAEDEEGLGYAADYSINGIATHGNRWIPDAGWVSDQITEGSASTLIEWEVVADGGTGYYVIGETTTDVAFTFKHIAVRGTDRQYGTIEVVYTSYPESIYYFSEFIPAANDLGITITADYSGTDIRLVVTVDSSSSNNLSFDYKLINKFHN